MQGWTLLSSRPYRRALIAFPDAIKTSEPFRRVATELLLVRFESPVTGPSSHLWGEVQSKGIDVDSFGASGIVIVDERATGAAEEAMRRRARLRRSVVPQLERRRAVRVEQEILVILGSASLPLARKRARWRSQLAYLTVGDSCSKEEGAGHPSTCCTMA